MARPRVLIADDHPALLERVAALLEPEYDVVAAVTDGRAAVEAAIALRPDVVILDISMPILCGLEAAARIAKSRCAQRIVMLTMLEDPDFLAAAREAGAHGYVVKRTLIAELLPAIKLVLDGRCAFPVRFATRAAR
jgi:DNA-binding NarL/FixJ family response regulator